MNDVIPSLDDPMHSTSDVAKMFGVSEPQVRVWITEGKMKATKILGRWRIQESEIRRVANEEYGGE